MNTQTLEKQIKTLEAKLQNKDEEILLLQSIMQSFKEIQKKRSSDVDKKTLKKLEDIINNL